MDVRPRKGEVLPPSWFSDSFAKAEQYGSSGCEYNIRPMPFPNPFVPKEHVQLCSFHAQCLTSGTLQAHDVLTHRPHSFFTLTSQSVKDSLISVIKNGVQFASPSASDMMNVSMTILADTAPLQRVCPGVTIQAAGRCFAPLNSHRLDPSRIRELIAAAVGSVTYPLAGIFFLSRGVRSVWTATPYPDLSPEENRARLVSNLQSFQDQIVACQVGQEFLIKDWLASFAETKFNCSYLDFHYDRLRVGPVKDNVLATTRARIRVQSGPIPRL